MMKLSSIRIKGMHKVDDKTYDLSGNNLIYFHGKNGAGKSTILQAIQLALLGYIPGSDKNKSAIFKHANGPEMSVKLDIDDGDISILRVWKKIGKDINATITTVPENLDITSIFCGIELPVFNFNDFIGMTSNKLKDWFINFLPDTDTNIDWSYELNHALQEANFDKILVPEYVEECIEAANNISSTGLEMIRIFNAYLKEQQSFKKGELIRLQSTIQSLVLYEDCDCMYTVDELKQHQKELYMLQSVANEKQLLIHQNADIRKQMAMYEQYVSADSAELDPTAIQLSTELSSLTSHIVMVSNAISKARQTLTVYKTELSGMGKVLNSKGVCPYTNTSCESITSMMHTFEERANSLQDEINKCGLRIQEYTKELNDDISQKNSLEVKIDAIKNYYVKYNEAKSRLHEEVADVTLEDITSQLDKYASEIDKITDTISKLEANKKYNELMDQLTTEKYQTEQAIEILKVWVKLTDVNGLQSKVMNAPFVALADKVSLYLRKFFNHADLTAEFFLSEKANSFSFGIRVSDSDYIGFDYLSSGEKCLYTLALLLSIVETSDAQLPLILVDDLLDHLDNEKIKTCFETLYDISTIQVLLAGVQECTHPKATQFVVEVNDAN